MSVSIETPRQLKARLRRESDARIAANREEGQRVWKSMQCPTCGHAVEHNNSLAGVIWLQCLGPNSIRPTATGCGYQVLFDRPTR